MIRCCPPLLLSSSITDEFLPVASSVSVALEEEGECWTGYNFTPYYWILEGPRMAIIVTNTLFLLNILRVLLTTLRNSNSSETVQVRFAMQWESILKIDKTSGQFIGPQKHHPIAMNLALVIFLAGFPDREVYQPFFTIVHVGCPAIGPQTLGIMAMVLIL